MSRSVRAAQRIAVLSAALVAAGCDDVLSPSSSQCGELQAIPAGMERSPLGKQARVRISLVSRLGTDAGSGESLRSAGVRLRKNGRCFQLEQSSTTRLGSVEGMTGGLVADVVMDPGALSEIVLTPAEGSGGPRLAAEKVSLRTPVELEAGKRTEIFIALDSVAGREEVMPRFVAAGPVPLDAGTVIVVEPGRKGSLSLRGGFAMDWPGNALREAAVYGIVENDVGGVAPRFSIMPAGRLDNPVGITLPLQRARVPQGFTMADYGASVAGAHTRSAMAGNLVSFDARETGVVTMSTDRPYMELTDGSRIASPFTGGTGTSYRANVVRAPGKFGACLDRLAANRSSYLSRLASGNAGIRVTDCESVVPYVHIVLVNLAYAKPAGYTFPRLVLPAVWYTGTNTFVLNTINEHANLVSGTFTAINGFVWEGDDGSGEGSGVPIGTLYISGQRKSPAYTGGEAILGFTVPYSTGTSAAFFAKPSGTSTVNLGSYSNNAVPSTTSIIRNGACNGEGRYDRWSSIGIGKGVLVMVSSVQDTETYDTDLCSVYQGLDIMGGAIRLDGGPSAAISWLGNHLNPLTGVSSYYYGSARHLAYAVGAVY